MISQSMQEALNAQIQAEIYSSHLYLSMASFCESINLRGFARWMRAQAQEELGHAMKFFDHLIERGGRAQVRAIDAPPQEWRSPREVFDQALAHEKHVTGLINQLYERAMEEKDYASQSMLQWFISEQVEEEATATEYVEKLRMIGESSNAIFFLDKELGKRGKG